MKPPWTPTGQIEIHGLRIYAYHGVDPQENVVGNEFEIDMILEFNCAHAMQTDRLDTTINYADVVEIIKAEMAHTSKLLEHVGQRIYDALTYRYSQITGGSISIYKIHPPISAQMEKVGFSFRW